MYRGRRTDYAAGPARAQTHRGDGHTYWTTRPAPLSVGTRTTIRLTNAAGEPRCGPRPTWRVSPATRIESAEAVVTFKTCPECGPLVVVNIWSDKE
jgi:hypothetical protein